MGQRGQRASRTTSRQRLQIGAYLQARRHAENITSERMARHLKIHVSTLSRWESGERGIGLPDLIAIEQIFPVADDVAHFIRTGSFPKQIQNS